MKKFFVALLFSAAPLVMQASPVAITTNPTLTIGGFTFDGFTCSISLGGTGATPTLCSEINVGTISGPGLQITSGFAAVPGSFSDAVLGYTVTSTTPISSIGLNFNGVLLGLGVSNVTESVYSGTTLVGFASVSAPGSLSSTIALSGSYTDLTIMKDIMVNSTLPGGTSSTISIINQTFGPTTSVPEPGSLALMGASLFGFGLVARRRIAK